MKTILLSYQFKNRLSEFMGWAFTSILLLLLTSCNKQLVEEPKSLAVETFYNTASEVEAATNAIYTPFRDINGLPSYIAQVEAYVDYGLGRGSYAVLNDFQGLNATNVSRIGTMWDLFYLSIRNANLVIKNAPNGKSINKADIDKYVGEAKFLRAFNYFHLVRNWAGVPVRTEANMTEIEAKRNTADEVYTLIVTDLKEAETLLPDRPALTGRPSKWAAKTLLADVYLQLNKFAEARDKADEVIKANKYSLVSISSTDDLQKIFGPDIISTPEEIFTLNVPVKMDMAIIGWCFQITPVPNYMVQVDFMVITAMPITWCIRIGIMVTFVKAFGTYTILDCHHPPFSVKNL